MSDVLALIFFVLVGLVGLLMVGPLIALAIALTAVLVVVALAVPLIIVLLPWIVIGGLAMFIF